MNATQLEQLHKAYFFSLMADNQEPHGCNVLCHKSRSLNLQIPSTTGEAKDQTYDNSNHMPSYTVIAYLTEQDIQDILMTALHSHCFSNASQIITLDLNDMGEQCTRISHYNPICTHSLESCLF